MIVSCARTFSVKFVGPHKEINLVVCRAVLSLTNAKPYRESPIQKKSRHVSP